MPRPLLPLIATALALVAAEGPAPVAQSRGAITIPVTMPVDGTATVALYSQTGQLLRPLAQALPLARGEHTIRWDGMDLWGHPVPVGTPVTAKVFAGPALRATWEFAIASPNPVPWPTKPFGEGAAQRTGGWLGDHGVSAAGVAVGDRIWFGSTMAEHGHTLITCNLDGEKMWGRGGLEGWSGPRMLASDGAAVFGVVGNRVHRVEPDGSRSARIVDTGGDDIVAVAAHGGRLVLTLTNRAVTGSVVQPEVGGGGDFRFDECLPVPDGQKAYNRNLTGQEQFATAFADGGHPQTGIVPAGGGATAGIVARFTKPMAIGSLVLERLPFAATVELYALPAGAKYGKEMAPTPGDRPAAPWRLVGSGGLERRLNVIPATVADLVSDGLYLRFQAKDAAGPKTWPKLGMCRLLPRRLERVDVAITVTLPAGATSAAPLPGVVAGDTAWAIHTAQPMTSLVPATVLLALARPTTFDALLLHNCVNRSFAVDAWTGGGRPDAAASAGWEEIATVSAGSRLIEGSLSASQHSNETRVGLRRTTTTAALRLRLTGGMGSGRWGNPARRSDARRSDVADIALLRLVDGRSTEGEMILQVRDAVSGALQLESRHPSIDMTALAFDTAGTLYSVAANRLCVTTLPTAAGDAVQHRVLDARSLKKPMSLAVAADGARIAVGDDDLDAVLLFDRAGAVTGRIGGIGPRKRGPWDPRTVDRPSAVTFDRNGRIWVCELTFTPKRITRYSADGQPEKELLGPPHYGGGGRLDPSLKSFWYEAGEYAIDFAAGTSRLKNLNDVQADPITPTLDSGSYSYTKVGRPVRANGHRYIVGDVGGQYNEGYVICLFDEGQTVWKPAAVMGNAQDSVFLTREDKPWSAHWLAQDLSERSFIWCDLNGDGQYQVDEVQLFLNREVMGGENRKPFEGAYWGTLSGHDLTFWGACRLAPSRVTAQGVPVFEKARIQPFDYAKLAPTYMANLICNQSAKTGFGGALVVARDGSAAIEGQPYVVEPDLTLRGGPVAAKPSDHIPRILGTVLDNPLSFVGSAPTESAVGEVAMMNGDNGRWFLWAMGHGVVLGEIFTGKAGGFGGLTAPTRGLDITDYKQDWETFFGDFVRGDDGRYYVVAGRGHFGLSQVHGIDAITVSSRPVAITAEAFAANARLRADLVAADKPKKREKRVLEVKPVAARAPQLKLDGDLAEWGELQPIGEGEGLGFAAAWSGRDLVLAYRGDTGTGNQSEDWRYIFKTGFAFDLLLRSDPKAAGGDPARGDRRLVFARHRKEWVAVLYDFVHPDAAPGEGVTYTSPVASTRVDRVVRLPADAVRIAVREAAGGWSAEVQVAWTALGVTPAAGLQLRADVGILAPDNGGIQVGKRTYWSDPDTRHVADLAVEAEIHPGNWGTFVLR